MNVNVHTAEMNTKRMTGMGAVATLALAVLVFGCVLAATAGPREALNTRTQALRQTLATHPAGRTDNHGEHYLEPVHFQHAGPASPMAT